MYLNTESILLKKHFDKYSSAYILFFVVIFFSDSRVLLRTVFPVNGLAELIGAVLLVSFSFILFKVLFIVRFKIHNYGIALFIFGLASALRFVIAGKSLLTTLPGLLSWYFVVVFIASNNNEWLIRLLLKAFTIAMGLHLVAIFAPIDFIQKGLAEQTSYGITRYGTNVWTARSTGFNQAPGVLAFLAAQGVFIGAALVQTENKIQWIIPN